MYMVKQIRKSLKKSLKKLLKINKPNKKSYKKSYKKSLKTKRGGCGCSGEKPMVSSFLYGGNKIKGGDTLGSPSLTNYDPTNQYTYPQFDVKSDPLNSNQIIDSRQLPNFPLTGGKRRTIRYTINKKNNKTNKNNKRRSYRKLYKGHKGGSGPILQNYNNNLLTNSNTIDGQINGANIVSGNTSDVSKPFSTPLFL